MENTFEEIWQRIRGETGLKSLKALAEVVQISQPAVSEMKSKNRFPAGWAFEVEKKFGLLTKWIMTGEGPKRIHEKDRSAFLVELEEWAKEVSESKNLKWLENQIENQFPDFKRWREEKTQPSEITADCPSSKVA